MYQREMPDVLARDRVLEICGMNEAVEATSRTLEIEGINGD